MRKAGWSTSVQIRRKIQAENDDLGGRSSHFADVFMEYVFGSVVFFHGFRVRSLSSIATQAGKFGWSSPRNSWLFMLYLAADSEALLSSRLWVQEGI